MGEEYTQIEINLTEIEDVEVKRRYEKYAKCGVWVSTCKNCGVLPIEKFEIKKSRLASGAIKWSITSKCMKCARASRTPLTNEQRKAKTDRKRSYNTNKWAEARKNLTNCYVRGLIRRKFSGKITAEMIANKRDEIARARKLPKGTDSQRLSDCYVKKIIARQKKKPLSEITFEEIIEKREYIERRRKERGRILKPYKSRSKKTKS